MRYLFILIAALLLVPIAFTAAPAQAQQRTVRMPKKVHQQPRALTERFKRQVARNARTRAPRARLHTNNPRFYQSTAALRASQRLRSRTRPVATRSRARANISPRRLQPKFYNARSAMRASQRLRGSQKGAARARRAAVRRPTPTFWKN